MPLFYEQVSVFIISLLIFDFVSCQNVQIKHASFKSLKRNATLDCGLGWKNPFVQTKGRAKIKRISGGYDASPGEFPSHLHIQGSVQCGAVLLNKRYALSSALCFFEEDHKTLKNYTNSWVTFGKIVWPENEQFEKNHSIAKVCIADEFWSNEMSNYAVVKLNQEIDIEKPYSYVWPACLPKEKLIDNQALWTVGFGFQRKNGQNLRPEHLQVLPTIKSSRDSGSRYLQIFQAKYHPGFPCTGDMGDPIIGVENARMTIYGIVSSVDGNCINGRARYFEGLDVYSVSYKIAEILEKC